MTLIHDGTDWELRLDTELIETGPQWEPNSAWRFVDPQGHVHQWDGDELPTCHNAVVRRYWCEDCHDEHTVHGWRCRQCDAEVHPSMRWREIPTRVPGIMTISGRVLETHPGFASLVSAFHTGPIPSLRIGGWTLQDVRVVAVNDSPGFGSPGSGSVEFIAGSVAGIENEDKP